MRGGITSYVAQMCGMGCATSAYGLVGMSGPDHSPLNTHHKFSPMLVGACPAAGQKDLWIVVTEIATHSTTTETAN